MVPNHTHNWLVAFNPEAEGKGALGSLYMVLRWYICMSVSFSHIVPPFCLSPLLLHLHLCLHLRLPHVLQIWTPHTIYVLPDIPSAAPHPDTAPILYESWCIGMCCSGVGVHTSPPPPGLLLTPPPPKAGYPIAHMYRVTVSSLPNGIQPCGGILWGSAWSKG